jgi:hypothetical protein
MSPMTAVLVRLSNPPAPYPELKRRARASAIDAAIEGQSLDEVSALRVEAMVVKRSDGGSCPLAEPASYKGG